MVNPYAAEEDVRIVHEYIRDLSAGIESGLTVSQAVIQDYIASFGKTKEEACELIHTLEALKQDYKLNRELAEQELPEQYLEHFITALLSNPSYTLSQKYQLLAMAKAYFLKISCISLGDALLKKELSLSFEEAMTGIQSEFSDRMNHASEASEAELEALYEEVLLASESALVMPHPVEMAQTVLDYLEQNLLTPEQQKTLEEKDSRYLLYTYALYKAVSLGTLTMRDLEELKAPEFTEELLSFLSCEVLAISDLAELVQDIRGGRTSLEKAQSIISTLVSVLFGAAIAGFSVAAAAGTAALIAEAYLSFGVLAGTVTFAGIFAALLANAENISDFAEYLFHTARPQAIEACQIAAKRLAALCARHAECKAARKKEESPETGEPIETETPVTESCVAENRGR